MYLKLMSAEDLADHRSDKTYRMIECKDIQFYKNGWNGYTGPCAVADNCVYALFGNAYVLNNSGKTVDTFTQSYSVSPVG